MSPNDAGLPQLYLKAGELLSMPQGMPHSVEGVEDALFVLTFAAV